MISWFPLLIALAAADTGAVDTGSADTGAADTGFADTGEADTGSTDTGSTDTGAAESECPVEESDICTEGTRLAADDFDGDGLPDDVEEACGSDPCNPDTDHDGIWDGVEVQDQAPCGPDSDGDGTPDLLDNQTSQGSGSDEDTLRPESGSHGLTGGQYTGGACSTGAGTPAFLPAVFMLSIVFRRRWAPATACALVALPVQAQQLNVQRLEPTNSSRHFVVVEDGAAAPHGLRLSALSHYAYLPFMYRTPSASTPIVEHLWTNDLGVAYNHGRVSTAINLPIHTLVAGLPTDSPRWLGDTRLSTRVVLIERETSGLGVATSGSLGLPSGNGVGWLGAPGVHGTGAIALSTGERIHMGLNLGFAIGPRTDLDSLTLGTALLWRAGVAVPVGHTWSVAAEIDSAHHVIRLDSPGAHPMEGLLSARYQATERLALSLGGSKGVSQGVGTPVFRTLLGATWHPAAHSSEAKPAPLPPQPPPATEAAPPEEAAPEPHEVLSKPILFAANSTAIDSTATEQLKQYAQVLKTHPGLGRIEIRGHAAAGESQPTPLSLQRAEAAMIWLVRHGVPGTRVTARGYGASDAPSATGPDAQGRVVLHIVQPAPPSIQ